MKSREPAAAQVFFSYSHKDEALRDELEKHLSILKRQGLISAWHDRKIRPGKRWATEIDQHLKEAELILLLVSPDFLSSNYCYGIEMELALRRQELGEARVIPIIVRPVDWDGAPFATLQALPKDGKPVTLWPNQDEAFVDVCRGIRSAVAELSERRLSLAAEWKVVIEGTLDNFGEAKLESILNELKKVSGDLNLRIKRVERGSVKLVVQGTPEAFARLASLQESGRLDQYSTARIPGLHQQSDAVAAQVARRLTFYLTARTQLSASELERELRFDVKSCRYFAKDMQRMVKQIETVVSLPEAAGFRLSPSLAEMFQRFRRISRKLSKNVVRPLTKAAGIGSAESARKAIPVAQDALREIMDEISEMRATNERFLSRLASKT